MSRARARDLEHTFDYEDYFCNEQELEERELSSKIHELREQNGFLEHMCSLVLQKSRAAHDENQALLQLIEMLNLVKSCITLNQNPLPNKALPHLQPSNSVDAAQNFSIGAHHPRPNQPDCGPPEGPNGPPSPTLIAPHLISHDSVVADAEQDPNCVSPAGKPRRQARLAFPGGPPFRMQSLDSLQAGTSNASNQEQPGAKLQKARSALPSLDLSQPGDEARKLQPLDNAEQQQQQQQQQQKSAPEAPAFHPQSGTHIDLKDIPYNTSDPKSLEAVAAAALAHNERHVAGAIIDLLLLGARRRSGQPS